jgi:hypothetical protein
MDRIHQQKKSLVRGHGLIAAATAETLEHTAQGRARADVLFGLRSVA